MLIGLIKFIIILVGIYYLTKFLSRYVLPLVLRNYVRKKMGGHNQSQQYRKKTKEGKININQSRQQKKHFNKDEGEYVDFEEVRDE